MITLTLRLADEVPGSLLTNTVEANLLAGEPYTDDNVATVSTPLPDLGIRKSVVPKAAAPGDTITYTLVFSNAGNEIAQGVVVSDAVPASVTVQSVVSSGAIITDTGVSPPYLWRMQDLGPEQGGVITITGLLGTELPDEYVITNTAVITGTTADSNPKNNHHTVELGLPVDDIYFPLIYKAFVPNPISR